jgi:hypothetical protein
MRGSRIAVSIHISIPDCSGLRPSEEIALLVKDFDPVRRAVTVNKARVAGIDKDSTKTGEASSARVP